ncbi:MAG TPA: FHA domain-containing protein [Actinocrinis sp.]|nr:FHA domain-containing protein [Actinocrinis sp.]
MDAPSAGHSAVRISNTLTIRVLPAGMELYFDGSHPVTIGRDKAAHVLVRDNATSPEHAVLRLEKGRWVFEDRSVNGTYLDGSQIPSRLPLDRAVTLALGAAAGGAQLRIIPPARFGEKSPHVPEEPSFAPGQVAPGHYAGSYQMASSRIRIGRSLDNEIVLDDLLVSRHHAELRVTASGALEVIDLGSRDGTFVDGRPVEHRTVLGEGSLIAVGHTLLRLRGGALEKYSDTGISFASLDLSVTAGKRTVLDDVSFAVSGGHLTAVLGPAGSGKSTLLRALAGQRPVSRGTVLYNGRDLFRDFAELRSRIGYVPQGDTLHAKLTVRSVLEYAARLRFPTDASSAERADRVDEVLAELGLSQAADVRVERLPGGLRKRASIAVELLAEPSLVILDEPTSGLDPGDQQSIMELLRKLADHGRTVLVVTRSIQDLDLCDRLMFLAPGGQVAYFGSPGQVLEFFRLRDYPHVFRYLDQVTAGRAKERFASSAQAQEFVHGPLAALRAQQGRPVAATPIALQDKPISEAKATAGAEASKDADAPGDPKSRRAKGRGKGKGSEAGASPETDAESASSAGAATFGGTSGTTGIAGPAGSVDPADSSVGKGRGAGARKRGAASAPSSAGSSAASGTDLGATAGGPNPKPGADQPGSGRGKAAAPAGASVVVPDRPGRAGREHWSRSPYSTRQLLTLSRRYVVLTVANRRGTLLNLVQAPILGLIMLGAFGKDDLKPGSADAAAYSSTVLIVLTLGAVYLGAFTAVREIAKERAILARERADGLSGWAYVLSKTLLLSFLTIVECFALAYIALLRQGGQKQGVALANFDLEMAVVLSVTGLAGMALGLLISAVARNGDRVAAVLPVVLFAQFALSGAAFPVTTVPGLDQVSYVAAARWGYSAAAGTARLDELLGTGCNGSAPSNSSATSTAATDVSGAAATNGSGADSTGPSPTPRSGTEPKSADSTGSSRSAALPKPALVCDPAHASTTTAWSRDLGILVGLVVLAVLLAGLAVLPVGRPRRR